MTRTNKSKIFLPLFVTSIGAIPVILSTSYKVNNIDYPTSLAQLKKFKPEEIALFSKYDSRDFNLVSRVDNQNPYGNCWVYSIAGVSEFAILRSEITSFNN